MSMLDQAVILAGRQYRLSEISIKEAPAVLDLFGQVFGERPPDGWFEWKYSQDGLNGRALGLWNQEGKLLAHYAGFPRTLLWQGRLVEAIQIGDVMVAPEARGLLTRRGPFFQVCTAFFNRWVGAGKRYALAFGFPNARAMRLGEQLDLYYNLGPIRLLKWPAVRQQGWIWRVEEIDPAGDEFERVVTKSVGQLDRERADRVHGVRNVEYFRVRFAQRPGVHHRFLVVARRGFGPTALVVVTIAGNVLRWLDFVGPSAVLPAATAALQKLAALHGLAQVETWSSPAAQQDLLATGAQVTATAAYFAVAKASDCPNHALASHGWWLAGDTDFL